jgi:NitT/TauT family transport system permease protein
MKLPSRYRLIDWLSVALIFCALCAIWEAIILVLRIPRFILPSPWEVVLAVFNRRESLFTALRITSSAVLLGLLASVVAGMIIAIIFAQSHWIRRMLYPYTILLQTVPIVAISPLIVMWAGPGTVSVSVSLITFIICLAPIIANATQGLISVDKNLVSLFAMHNASRIQTFWKLRLPHAVPSLFVGLRISSGISVIGGITGELFAGSSRVGEGGIGYSIMYASTQLQTDYLFALVFVATALGFAFFFLVSFLEWYFLHHWHESALGQEND